jgi:hypothetical protein
MIDFKKLQIIAIPEASGYFRFIVILPLKSITKEV